VWLAQVLARQDAYLEGAALSRAQLSGVQLPNQANLAYAILTGADLRGSVLILADLRNAFLNEAQLQDASVGGADLRGAHVSGAYLQGADLAGARLHGARLKGIRLDRYSRCSTTNWGAPWQEIQENWWAAADVFCILRQHYHESGFYAREDDFYIREMRCRQLSVVRWTQGKRWRGLLPWIGWKMWGRRIGWSVHRLVWGYGAMPWLLPLWMLLCVCLFAALFMATGVRTSGHPVSHSFWQGMALSLITFGTLGYGNRWPDALVGEALAGIEAMMAMVLTAMFVVSLARKCVRG
jgi:hypothetical protein